MVKFLIIRFSSIGDIVLTSPVIRIIKTQIQDSEIHFLTKAAFTGLLLNNPHITKVHTLNDHINKTILELKDEEFDYIIDLQNNITSLMVKRKLRRMYFTVNKLNLKKWIYVNLKINLLPQKHIVERYLETLQLFDIHNDMNGLDCYIAEDENIKISDLPDYHQRGYIAMVLGAKHATKKMPSMQLALIAKAVNYPIILIGGKEDYDTGELIVSANQKKAIFNGCGKWSINQSASVIRQANCVITHDTGMMHIAAAFRKKIITIWGNTLPQFGMYAYLPDQESVDFEVKNLKCRPCSKLGKPSCPKKHFNCMLGHNTESIAEKANKLFESYAATEKANTN